MKKKWMMSPRWVTTSEGGWRRDKVMNVSSALAALTMAGSLAGCAGQEPTAEDLALMGEEENVASITEKVVNGWTQYSDATEQNQYGKQVICTDGSMVNAAQCRWDNCSGIKVRCVPVVGGRLTSHVWTQFVSEEGPGVACSAGQWMTGLQCQDYKCDNVRIRCTKYTPNLPEQGWFANWTGWHSEENSAVQTPANNYARGIQCTGANCDWIRLYYDTPVF